jgi:tetratricopeptide (TPR) repeat protein
MKWRSRWAWAFLHSNLSLAYLDAGRYHAAFEAAQHAVARDFQHEISQWALVEALMLLERPDDAIAAFEATEAAGVPDTIGRANELAWLLYVAGDYAAAQPVIESFFADKPELTADHAYEADTYAHILAAVGHPERAVNMFRLALDLGGSEKAAAYREGLERLGIEAEDDLEAALRECAIRGAECKIGE